MRITIEAATDQEALNAVVALGTVLDVIYPPDDGQRQEETEPVRITVRAVPRTG